MKKEKQSEVAVDLNDLIGAVYLAYSELINREGFFGLKPEQKYVDALWAQSFQPRIVYHWEQVVAKRTAKEKEKEVTQNDSS
jgi:hypothetical protein